MTNKRKTTTTLDSLTNLLCLLEEFSKVFNLRRLCVVLSNILLHGEIGIGKYEIISCMHDPFLGKLPFVKNVF